eukprot:m.10289 g.10289  ORF g.10289 m.10289 type:complete len:484 (+) comp3744_c0_seq1:109-1560(+)
MARGLATTAIASTAGCACCHLQALCTQPTAQRKVIPPAPHQRRSMAVHVVVVGAGLSGLTAAHQLLQGTGAGVRVTVLEARPRIGGRLVAAAGAPCVDLGAAWTWSTDHALRALIRSLHAAEGAGDDGASGRLALVPQQTGARGSRLVIQDGNGGTSRVPGGAGGSGGDGRSRLAGGAASLPQALVDACTRTHGDRFQLRLGAVVSSIGQPQHNNGSRSTLSVSYHTSRDAKQQHHTTALGGATAPEPPACGEGEHGRIPAPTLGSAEDPPPPPLRQLAADAVILALPPRLVTARIQLPSSVPASVLQAAQHTPTWMEDTMKVALIYKQPFWTHHGFSGSAYSRAGPMSEVWDNSHGDVYALAGFVLGWDAEAMQSLPPPEREARVLAQMDVLFPGHREHLVETHGLLWLDQDLTHDATTFSEASGRRQARFGDPLLRHRSLCGGALVLAGTETEDEMGHMEGAVQSGLRAAAQIVKLLGTAK